MTRKIDNQNFSQNLEKGQYSNRYFILRNGTSAYNMTNLVLGNDKEMVSCHLDSLPMQHNLVVTNAYYGSNRYKKRKPESAVLNEVHLYITADSSAKLNSDFVFPVNNIERIELIEKNVNKTNLSYYTGGIGYFIGAFLMISGGGIAIENYPWK